MIAKFVLSDSHRRPVFGFIVGQRNYTALLDTGAEIPVFTYGKAKMEELGGKFAAHGGKFRGFGGECVGDLYYVDLPIGVLRFVDLPVICLDDPTTDLHFILPATIFTGFCYTINDNAKILTVDTLSSATEYRLKGMGGGRDVMVIFEERTGSQTL